MKQMSLNMIPLIMSHAQDETLAYCGVNPFSQTIQRMPKDGFQNGVDVFIGLVHGAWSPKTSLKCSKSRSFVLLNGKNNFTLIVFRNGVLPFRSTVLIGEFLREIIIAFEF